jgi:hypothetical protein
LPPRSEISIKVSTVSSELNEKNYRRITLINWSLTVPLLLIFAWPYYFICELSSVEKFISYPGSILFAIPFMLTILHGHVTMALGTLHRHHYYHWLSENPLTYGLLFHEILISTRFRLILLITSGLILLIASFL